MKKLSILITMLFLASLGFAEKNETDTIKMQDLGEVVISASRTKAKLKELPAKVEVITAKAISQSGARDMADLLKNNTSVDVIQYPNFLSGIGMRGFAPSTSTKYVTILVDGVPAGTMNMSTLMTNGVQQVEILKGPFSSLYGSSAMGGLINIVPAKNKGDVTGNVSLGYGTWNTWSTSAAVGGKIAGGLSFDVSGYYNKRDDNYKIGKKDYYSSTPVREAILDKKSYGDTMNNTLYETKGGSARLGYDFNENWSVNLYGTFFENGNNITNTNYWGTYGKRGLTKKYINLYQTRLAVEGKINKHLLKAKAYYSQEYYNGKDEKTGYKKNDNTKKIYGFQFQDVISFGSHKLVLGVDNQNVESEARKFDKKNGEEKKPTQPSFKNNMIGLFAQADLRFLKDKLILSTGVRYDFIKVTLEENSFIKNPEKKEDFNTFSPNLGLKYKLTENSYVHSSYGKAFLTYDAFQKAGDYYGAYGRYLGNPDLDPETSNTFDLGFNYKSIYQGVEVDLTYFHTEHKNRILTQSVNPDGIDWNGDEYTTYRNVEKGRFSGIELMTSYDFGSLVDYQFSLKAYFNATFMFKDEYKDYDSSKWEETRYVRDQTVNYGLQFRTENKWDVRLNGRYIGSRVEDNWFKAGKWSPSTRPALAKLAMQTQPKYAKQGLLKHPHFMVFDAHVYYNITKNLSVGVNANNFLDENYTEKDGYNMPGRNFMGKVSYKF